MSRFAPFVVVALLGSVAHAEEEVPTASDAAHLAVSGTFGIATPLGEAGLELEAHLASWLSLSAGVGLGASGPQLAVMARGGYVVGNHTKIYLGAGLSEGRYTWNEFLVFDEPAQKVWSRAYWVNGELGFDHQFNASWSARAFAGQGRVLDDQAYTCNSDHCLMDHQQDGEQQLYVGLAVARAFATM